MYRLYQMMSNGQGAVALGTVKIMDAPTAQLNQRDYPIQIGLAGTTAQRPKAGDPDFPVGMPAGLPYLDTTLGYVIHHDGTGAWRNGATGAKV
jgi:hypothetical protein